MEPKVALTTAPTAKLLCAEMLQGARKDTNKTTRRYIKYYADLQVSKALPGYSHADVVGEGDDGGDGCCKHGLWTEVLVLTISVAKDQSDQYEGKQVCEKLGVKGNKTR